ncbi:FAD-dependent oxidoreductase [Saliphagus sp. LR7]|uniref:FAD-dependent oxidoreductase n=1 Tax=Saliphagus sp. LR7 TaxID=2282654 RepID=UPI000DF82C41|nr:FAD-dependent oxidoreductase [Saliphagus sp. LR7]
MARDPPARADLPGEPTSPWLATTRSPGYDPLESDVRVEVAVLGGGIAGLSTAHELRERGHAVAVVERDELAAGITGKTTAKLTSHHGLKYDRLRREFGPDTARTYAAVNERAIDTVEERVADWDGDFGFRRLPNYVYGDGRDAIEREVAAASEAGLDASFVTSVPPFDRAACGVRVDDQACFHPRQYLLELADRLAGRSGTELFEHTRVTGIEPGSPCRIETTVSPESRADGDGPGEPHTVLADRVVVATGAPILDRAGYFARLHPKRSYVLGIRLDGRYPEGMYYDAGEPYRSVRPHRDGEGDLLLVGGENHKTGQGGSTAERYRRLAAWARERFPVESIDYRWSTQDYVPADGLPFIGRLGIGTGEISVITGFGGWGMTTGVAAGELLAREIDGEQVRELEPFDPLRATPKASLPTVLTEGADSAGQFATDWARALLADDGEPIEPGEGRVVRRGSKPIAVSRSEDGELRAVSAVCTHMDCLVDWNDGENSWDCPCHGSRFSPDGRVLEGPASDDLPPREPDG